MSESLGPRRHLLRFGASYLFLGAVGITMIFPLLWMVLTSLKTPAADVLDPNEWWPKTAWRLGKSDVANWPRFCQRWVQLGAEGSAGPARRIWISLSRRPRDTVLAVSRRDSTPVAHGKKIKASQLVLDSEKGIILNELNKLFERTELFQNIEWTNPQLKEAARSLPSIEDISRDPKNSASEENMKERCAVFNRAAFDHLFAEEILPAHRFHWENYRTVMVEVDFARAFLNSVFVTLAVTLGMVFTSSLAAFAFSRLRFTGRDRIFLCYLGTMMVPAAVTMIPVFILMRELRWVNTYYALIFPGMFSAYGTFMLRQFFMGIPRDLEEAALLDGCSTWGIYRHVVLPLSKPALAALTILTFMGAWRGFLWPLIVTHTSDMFTLPVALAAFKEMHGVRWTLMMAGSVIMILPMLIVFISGQRYFIEGIKLGAIKG